MDLGLRDWLFIIGPIFVVAVLVHGYWRMRRNSNTLKMSLDHEFKSGAGEKTEIDDLSLLKAELPSGGARVIGAPPEQGNLNLEEDVPVLMDPVSLRNNEIEQDIEDQLDGERERQVTTAAGQSSATHSESEKKASAPETIVVIHLFSNRDGFNGQQLLENLVSCGLKFGEMNIFHRYDADSNDTLFSMVNGLEPGTFDLKSMETLTTPAVSFFMKLHELDEPIAAYDLMLTTVRQLAEEMDGNLKDESRSVLTNQTIEHWRQAITEYSLKYSRTPST